jgi:DNA primase
MTKKPFVDFRDIRSRITIEQVLQHYNLLATFKRIGHLLIGPCPIHKGTNNKQFHVDLEKNVWTCFSECKHDGNALDFIAKMEGVPIHTAALKACEWFVIPLEEVTADEVLQEERTRAIPMPLANNQEPSPLEREPNPVLQFRLEELQREHPYLTQERGLTLDTIREFGIGYFSGNRGMMAGQIVIPIHNVQGELVAYVGRFPGEPAEDTPKYRIPPNFKMSQEVFNLNRAIKESADTPLVIVQGFFDCMKLHQNGCRKVVAFMDNSMSATQEELIRTHTNKNSLVIVMLNENQAGQIGRENIAGRLVKSVFVKTHVFDHEDQQPEHLSAEEVSALMQ